MKKLTLLTAAATGYVLGARAGRQRYEQIASGARTVMGNPKVQAAKQHAQDAVAEQASTVKDMAAEKAREAASTLADKVRRADGGSHAANGASPTDTAAPRA